MVFLKLSRSSTATVLTSSVLTKSVFDRKLYLIKIFLWFNKNHLHRNIGVFFGLTLTTDLPLKPNLTGLCHIAIVPWLSLPVPTPWKILWTICNTTNQIYAQLTIFLQSVKIPWEFTLQNRMTQQPPPTQSKHDNTQSSTVRPCTKDAQSTALSTHSSRRPEIGNHKFSWQKTSSFTYPPH